jgi:lipopolysaccharide export system permease protein
MWILDKQRYWAFLKAYAVCFTSLIGLYVVIDVFSNFDEFTKRATGASELFPIIGRYYLVHMTEMYDRLCGVIGMMAAIFTVTWMQRNNELLAMLAAGISTHRVIRPVLISSVLVSCLAIVNQEFLMPDLSEELQRSHADDGTQEVNFVSSRIDANKILMVGQKADRAARTISSMSVTLPIELYGTIRELYAKEATHYPPEATRAPYRGGWLLRGVDLNQAIDPELLKGSPLVKLPNAKGFTRPGGSMPELGGETYFLYSTLTFPTMCRSPRWYAFATTIDLMRGVRDPSLTTSEKLDVEVFLHTRLLRPLMGLALLCVTLPQVLGGYGKNMFINLGLSLGTAAVFYGMGFLAQYLGANQVIPSELSAWAPLIGFGTFAALRWSAIRT